MPPIQTRATTSCTTSTKLAAATIGSTRRRAMLPTRSMPIMTNGAATAALNGSGGAENDGALRGEEATIALRKRRLGGLHLALAAFAPQLPHRPDQEEHARHPGVTVTQACT